MTDLVSKDVLKIVLLGVAAEAGLPCLLGIEADDGGLDRTRRGLRCRGWCQLEIGEGNAAWRRR